MITDDWPKLAILYDNHAKYSPSNQLAIDKFMEAAIKQKIYPTIIQKADIDMLPYFDSLLIRDTTHPNNYTFQFAILAELLGIKVLDTSRAIMLGSNKITQTLLFNQYNIPHPKTWISDSKKYKDFIIANDLFPCVVKVPDACFSQGVSLIKSPKNFNHIISRPANSSMSNQLIIQEFMPTEFDWRIGILNKEILFAVKYYMVENDWKIIKYDRQGEYIDGRHENVSIQYIPQHIVDVVHQCTQLLDNGLYGIDIKEIDNKPYVIEINDNPNIDAGIEDNNEDVIYDKIINYFKT